MENKRTGLAWKVSAERGSPHWCASVSFVELFQNGDQELPMGLRAGQPVLLMLSGLRIPREAVWSDAGRASDAAHLY